LQQLAIVVGLSVAFLSNWALAQFSGGAAQPLWLEIDTWRWMFWVEIVPALAFLLGSALIPESPRFCIAKGRDAAAARVFARILDGDVAEKIVEVRRSLGRERDPRLTDLLVAGTRRLQPIVWIGVGLSVFQQLVGINVVFYYGSVLWESAGFDESRALLTNVIAGTTNVAATFVAIACVDRFGRRPLLLVGSAGMTVTLGLLALLFASGTIGPDGRLVLDADTGVQALVVANLYVVFFAVSWGPVVWVLLGEMFNNRIRGAGLAVAAAAQWVANFAVTMTFPILLARIGLAGAYALYFLCAAVSLAFVHRFVAETNGRELESM
jgi:SP family sugar:H+ symporter-like MFS transporter